MGAGIAARGASSDRTRRYLFPDMLTLAQGAGLGGIAAMNNDIKMLYRIFDHNFDE